MINESFEEVYTVELLGLALAERDLRFIEEQPAFIGASLLISSFSPAREAVIGNGSAAALRLADEALGNELSRTVVDLTYGENARITGE